MDIKHTFSFHPPKDNETKLTHEAVREQFIGLAEYMGALLKDGREKSLCITKLQEAMMWANASIALNQ